MITSLFTSSIRVLLAWYMLSLLVLFLGNPEWAQSFYISLARYPFVPQVEFKGLESAAEIQLNLLIYWTLPLLSFVFVQLFLSRAWMSVHIKKMKSDEVHRLDRTGEFSGVKVASYSIGPLAMPTVPLPAKKKIRFFNTNYPIGPLKYDKKAIKLKVSDEVAIFLNTCTPDEILVCSELVQVLAEHPGHYAGAGHGVDLLEHTFNVAAEALKRCTPEFRLPFIAAFAHDIGKLITFRKDAAGEWERVGWHSREGARILAALPSFSALPISEQRALILTLKHGHKSYQLPTLAGDTQATLLAQRILYSVSAADKSATSAEKDRNLEKLKPQELLWQDFIKNIRTAPVVQRGPRGLSNQLNLPPGNPYVFIYESACREAAIKRLPEEVAAVLDLNRRNTGKIAKYTQILLDRLLQEGLLVTEIDGMTTPQSNPLWNIRSGLPNKDPDTGSRINGVIVVHAKLFWEKLNYKNSNVSDFIVQVECPNADQQGNISGPREDARNIPQIADKISLNLAPDEVNKTSDKASNGLSVMARLDDKKAAEIGLFTSETAKDITVTKRPSRRYETQTDSDIPGTYFSPKEPPKTSVVAPLPSAAHAISPAPSKAIQESASALPANAEEENHPASSEALKLEAPIDYLGLALGLSSGDSVPSSSPADQKIPAISNPLPHVNLPAELSATFEISTDPLDIGSATFGDPYTTFEAQEAYEQSVHFAPTSSAKEVETSILANKGNTGLSADPLVSAASAKPIGSSASLPSSVPARVSASTHVTAPPVHLSSGEQSGGVAVADAAAISRFQQLKLGDKFYTSEAPVVKQGKKKEGSLYNTGAAALPQKKSFPAEAPMRSQRDLDPRPSGLEAQKKVRRKYDDC